MKVKDFLKQFEGCDPEGELYINMTVGCCGDTEILGDPSIWEEIVLGKEPKKQTNIEFPPLAFLDSCRKYGSALRGGKT